MKPSLIEGIDFYFNGDGYMVFTEKYHLDRGHCCGNGCKHCPFEYEKVPGDKKEKLLARRREEKQ